MSIVPLDTPDVAPPPSLRPDPQLDVLSPERADYLASTRPTPFGQYLGQQFRAGIDSSFIGRAYEELTSPGARPSPNGRIPRANVATPDQSQVITKEQWKASPDYREEIPWQEGMTGPLAASLAQSFDARRWRDELTSQYQGGVGGRVLGFAAQLAGSALDPVNYIPILGPGARAIAMARYGAVAGHALVGGAEGLLNTAAVEPFIVGSLRSRGEDIGIPDVALDLALSGIAGGVLGGGAGALERRSLARMAGRERVSSGLDQLNAATHAVQEGAAVDVGHMAPPPVEEPTMRVYHGTPHEFSEFDAGKIGTGEGAQAYGHGLYFAESRAVGESYQRDLTRRIAIGENAILENNKIVGSTGNKDLDDHLIGAEGDIGKAIADIKEQIAELDASNKSHAVDRRGLRDTLAQAEQIQEQVKVSTAGHLLAVDIRAHPDDFLGWDKPLSEQSEKIKRRLDGADLADIANKPGETGNEIYNRLAAEMGDRGAASMLNAAGVPGIRYPDQLSRGLSADVGTHNIVLFDPRLARIAERNGVAVAAPEAPHPSVTEAEKRLAGIISKPRDELDGLARDLGLGDNLKEIPELQDVAAIERDAGLKPGEKESLVEADETAKVAEGYATAYETMVSCVARFS